VDVSTLDLEKFKGKKCSQEEVIKDFWAQVAQAVLMPLLVDKDNVGPSGLKAIQSMMVMRPTPDFQVGPLHALWFS